MNRVKCTFSTQANMEGGGIIFTCLNIFFCHFSYGNMKKASRITNNILIIIIKWSGAGGWGCLAPPLPRHCLYFCVHTQLQYVYNRITVRLGPRNSRNKVSVHLWRIYSTSSHAHVKKRIDTQQTYDIIMHVHIRLLSMHEK